MPQPDLDLAVAFFILYTKKIYTASENLQGF